MLIRQDERRQESLHNLFQDQAHFTLSEVFSGIYTSNLRIGSNEGLSIAQGGITLALKRITLGSPTPLYVEEEYRHMGLGTQMIAYMSLLGSHSWSQIYRYGDPEMILELEYAKYRSQDIERFLLGIGMTSDGCLITHPEPARDPESRYESKIHH